MKSKADIALRCSTVDRLFANWRRRALFPAGLLSRRAVIVIAAFLLTSCAHSGDLRTEFPYKVLVPDAPQLCDINANPNAYVGKTVVLEGVYVSDDMFFSYIEDERCPRYLNILSVNYRVSDRDLSVDLFEKADKLRCANQSICFTAAHIVVRGVIVETLDSGHLGQPAVMMPSINVHAVLYVRFLESDH